MAGVVWGCVLGEGRGLGEGWVWVVGEGWVRVLGVCWGWRQSPGQDSGLALGQQVRVIG